MVGFLVWLGLSAGRHTAADIELNLATELLGIALTVAVIEWFLERTRYQESAKKLAFRTLDELDHAVWVWQGGVRAFDTAELLASLDHVSTADPLPNFTQNLFIRIGSRAAHNLRVDPEVVGSSPALRQGLISLSQLSRMRDHSHPMGTKEIAQHAREATLAFIQALEWEIPESPDPLGPSGLTSLYDSREEAQRWRHFGEARRS